MPASQILLKTANFSPETLVMLSRVYEDAWGMIELRPQDDQATLRTALTDALITLAKAGQLEPEKLKADALSMAYALSRTRSSMVASASVPPATQSTSARLRARGKDWS